MPKSTPQVVLGRMQLALHAALAEQLTVLRSWCKQDLGGETPDVLRSAVVGMRVYGLETTAMH